MNSDLQQSIIPCPPPSRGGAFSFPNSPGKKKTTNPVTKKDKDYVHGQLSSSPPAALTKERSMNAQIKLLREHYTQTAKQPCSIRCTIGLTPPQAKAVCPQTKRSVVLPTGSVYAADVPQDVLVKSRALSGHTTLDLLSKQKKRVFTISYSQPQEEDEGEGWIHLGASSLSEDRHGWFSEPQSYHRQRGSGKGGDRFGAERENLLRYSSRHLPW